MRNYINLTTTLRKLLFSLKQLFIKIYQTTCFMVFTNLCFFNGPQIIIVIGMLWCFFFIFPNHNSIALCHDFVWTCHRLFYRMIWGGGGFYCFCVYYLTITRSQDTVVLILQPSAICRSDLLTPIFKVRLWYLSQIATSHDYHFL